MSDSAEAERYSKMHGLGDVIYENPGDVEDLNEMFQDLGLGANND